MKMLAFLIILVTVLNGINCGGDERILGGTLVTDRRQVPYQATLRWELLNTCGGVILNKRYVLTSAYCVAHNNTSKMKVFVGDIKRDPTSTTFQTEIEEIKIHEKYSSYPMNGYDIALVRVKNPFEFSDFIKPLDIWKSKKRPLYRCSIAGYGSAENSEFPSNLRIAQVHVQDNDFCNRTYKETLKITVPPTEFCAGEYKKDACDGDQGSPLVCDNKVVGIRSKDFVCSERTVGIPGLYLNVSLFETWITKNMHDINSSTALAATLLTLCITFVGMLL